MGKQFQRMRRRLTVTGASSNIDGVVGKGPDTPEPKKSKKKKVSMYASCQMPAVYDLTSFFLSGNSIKLLSDAQLQNILGYRRRVMLLTILGKRIKML